jgi:hypothetical protein
MHKRRLSQTCVFVLLAAAVAPAVDAQAGGQEKRTIREAVIGRPVIGVGGKKYLRSYATPDPGGPTVHCEDDGIDCVVEARLLQPGRLTPVHDAALQQATAEANRILEQAERSAPAGKALCLYRSIHGPLLIWRQAADSGPMAAARAPRNAVTDPAAMANLLGIQPSGGRQMGGNRNAELVWDEGLKHYVWRCPNPGTNCVIHGALATASARTVFDATLAQATEQLNNLFGRVAARPPRSGLRLCLLFVPAGPVLAWTSEGADTPNVRQQPISSEHPDFDRLSREALGLN